MLGCLSLNQVAEKTVNIFQAGGVSGIKMVDHILDLEAKAIQFVLTNQLLSGIFALDQAAAFPSISRRYIHWVLKVMCVPRRIRRLFRALYTGGKNGVSFGGRVYYYFVAYSGVKQGDPSSMVIFVLCFDPILRWIDSLLSPLGDCLFGYCDDVGIACRDVTKSWPIIAKCFHIVSRIAGLHLNTDKTQCCVLFKESLCRIMAAFQVGDGLPNPYNLDQSLFRNVVKYLGVLLGPGAAALAWVEVSTSYTECVKFLRDIDAGFTPTISLYNILCMSICSWVGSFHAPSRDLSTLESKSLQRLTHGPWNVFSKTSLFNLKLFGLPVQFHSIHRSSIASKVRNGCATASHFMHTYKTLQDAFVADDRVLHYSCREWMLNCCNQSIYDAIQHAASIGVGISDFVAQYDVSSYLRESDCTFDIKSFLGRLLSRFGDVSQDKIAHVLSCMVSMGEVSKPCVLSAYLFTVLNGWCTAGRFGLENDDCVFCGMPHAATVRHMATCPSAQNVILPTLNQNQLFLMDCHIFKLTNGHSLLSQDAVRFVFLYIYLLFRSFNAVRHGEKLEKRLIVFLCKNLSFHCSTSRSFLRALRRVPLLF